MGVTGLWEVVKPCARPIKIDTLNKKRLAVDASIWIYQFLKAVRDKEGNALRNSHVVGFFRRICKLLFFGIKPVFVFDGGAPALKRQTISHRKQRREGRREDAVRTAGKLLALQMQRRAEEQEQQRKDEESRPPAQQEEEAVPENPVYVDELQMTQQERQQNRRFKKKDQYHLPELDVPLSEMGGPNDPRVMSMEELEEYARQFDTGEDINVYDFSKIDFTSPFFTSLPATDRYNILNAARLRSRLRLGYSKDQLDTMFPDRMAFSRFQIERVRERNELTQRLMQVGTVEDGTFDADSHGRVAGEKGREYVLVKNPGVEGGWALGVIGDKDKEEGQREKPIDVDEAARKAQIANETSDSEESVNDEEGQDYEANILKKRQAFYESRKKEVNPTSNEESEAGVEEDPESLFVADNTVQAQVDDINMPDEEDSEDDEVQLQLAIAMSMEKPDDEPSSPEKRFKRKPFQQKKAHEYNPFSTSDARTVAKEANQQARRAAPPSKPFIEDDADESMDLNKALAESRPPRDQPAAKRQRLNNGSPKPSQHLQKSKTNASPSKSSTGPLPFEKLDLGSSLLGKKKMEKIAEENAGGFEKEDESDAKKRKAEPLPPWFSSDVKKGLDAQKVEQKEQIRQDREVKADNGFEFQAQPRLRPQATSEIIDVDEEDAKKKVPIALESSDDESDDQSANTKQYVFVEDTELRMGDLADLTRAEPPVNNAASDENLNPSVQDIQMQDNQEETVEANSGFKTKTSSPSSSPKLRVSDSKLPVEEQNDPDDSPFEWADSDREDEQEKPSKPSSPRDKSPKNQPLPQPAATRSESPDDVFIPTEEQLNSFTNGPSPPATSPPKPSSPSPIPSPTHSNQPPELDSLPSDEFSDPEDEDLLTQLTLEAEEHARFTSHFNSATPASNLLIYEQELSALRTQQKKDRRDADEVTHIMISECQQLLKLFGLPYITAPMEAEAQCAELVALGLVDGIVTDDSDIFLFGGTRVYKNMFNQAKFVECYLTADFVRDFDLTRAKLIAIANLLGSDYTEGLPGIGPVTALEILSEFDDLTSFRDWWSHVQTGAPPPPNSTSSSWKAKFAKSHTTKLFLPPAFPDARVELAYLQPDVDSDPSAFQWGVPDLNALRSFLMATIGWTQERTDEVLVPVIRDMNRRETDGVQSNITKFLDGNAAAGEARGAAPMKDVVLGAGAFAPRVRAQGKSRRMEGALERMAERARRRRREDDAAAAAAGAGNTKRKTRVADDGNDIIDADAQEREDEDEDTAKTRKARKSRRKAT